MIQSKLKSLHEVVVRNRLEQLRKRQRDEALQAQEELLAGVARSASRKTVPDLVPLAVPEEIIAADEIEAYDRSMSPPLIDLSKLSVDERDMEVLNEREDRRELVCRLTVLISVTYDRFSYTNVVQWRVRDLWPKRFNLLPWNLRKNKPRAASILLLKPCIGLRLKRNSTKRKKYSILRKISQLASAITGRTNTDPENPDTSIVCILGMNGTSITKLIMSKSF